MNVLEAARLRIEITFRDFDKVYLAFSGGKDSTILFHLAGEEARKTGKKFGVQFIDLEAQYADTILHIEKMFTEYSDVIIPFWCALPLSLRNASSVFEPKWICWEPNVSWVRQKPKTCYETFPFFKYGMEFEEFVPKFADWFSDGKSTAALIGIRTDESLNRYRAIYNPSKAKYNDMLCTTRVNKNVVNFYPIYDWKAQDVWKFHAETQARYNPVYEKMYKANVPIAQMRLCQPYGDDQRRGLYLYHVLEPKTWSKIVNRVAGINSGALYSQNSGNINGYRHIHKPANITWKQFANTLLASMPSPSKEQYESVIDKFLTKWSKRGYPDEIPEEAHVNFELNDRAPSWKRICWMLLRNDFYGKGLGFNAVERKDYEHTIS